MCLFPPEAILSSLFHNSAPVLWFFALKLPTEDFQQALKNIWLTCLRIWGDQGWELCSQYPRPRPLPTSEVPGPFPLIITIFKYSFIYLAALGLTCSMWDLFPWPGIKPRPLALGVQSLSQHTTKEVTFFPLRIPLSAQFFYPTRHKNDNNITNHNSKHKENWLCAWLLW